jgi:hypothetical protein
MMKPEGRLMRRPWTSGPCQRLSGSLCLAAALLACAMMAGGCGAAAKPKAAVPENCGTGRTAANVPIEIEVDRGQLACSVAMSVEKSYATAIIEGKVPGNGGGAPVVVDGWTCQGFPTPELLKTGEASKCARDGMEILAVLKTPA